MPGKAVTSTTLPKHLEIWGKLHEQSSGTEIAVLQRDDVWQPLFKEFFPDKGHGNEPYFNAFLREYKKYVKALVTVYLSAVTAEHNKASREEVAYSHRTMPGVNQDLEDVDARLIEIYDDNSSPSSRAGAYKLYLAELERLLTPAESVAPRSRSFSYLPEESLNGDYIENDAQEWLHSIHSRVLFGFTAVLGAAAVAIAFLALNAMTFGTAGLVTAGIGVSLFFTGAIGSGVAACRNNHQEDSEELCPRLA